MYLTQTIILRRLSDNQNKILSDMCKYANNLYNLALYNVRQYYFETGGYLSFKDNYQKCKNNENFMLLYSSVSSEVLRLVDSNFKSYFTLLKRLNSGGYNGKVKIPHYRNKGGLFSLIFNGKSVRIVDGYFYVLASLKYVYNYKGYEDVKIKVPDILKGCDIKEVRIVPFCNETKFKVLYIYEKDVDYLGLNTENFISVDIGVDNLASCVTNNGYTFIIDGKKLKSINHYWNKEMARLSSIASRQGIKLTKKMIKMTEYRNNRVNDLIKKASRYIVNYCISNNIGTIVIGYNKNIKKGINIGKVNNQNFYYISFYKLKDNLKYMSKCYGINYVEVEESYTSKSSFIDKDILPTCGDKYTGEFKGVRISRGLYKTKCGLVLNADINGACNIIRKSGIRYDFDEISRNVLYKSPERVVLN